jgi:alpha,alpha-trehalase
MVLAIDKVAHNTTWLKSVFPVLEQEYNFWMNPANGHTVSIPGKHAGDTIRLNIFNSASTDPRPESYREDLRTAARASQQYQRSPQDVYRGLRAAAESGWDFSSRWFAPAENVEYGIVGAAEDIATVNASAIVPVDLNCMLYRMELNLAHMQRLLIGFDSTSLWDGHFAAYEAAALRRWDDMRSLLWLEDSGDGHGTFRDYRLDTGEHSQITSLSDFAAPLWAFGSMKRFSNDVFASLLRSGLLQPGGALTTGLRTGQQWDAPNAWPPLQLMLIEGLDRLGDTAPESQRSRKIADDLASAWLQSNLKAWQDTGLMFEKYDAFRPGIGGGGGEYTPQVGFGWSNGVALSLLERAKSNGNSDISTMNLVAKVTDCELSSHASTDD